MKRYEQYMDKTCLFPLDSMVVALNEEKHVLILTPLPETVDLQLFPFSEDA